MEALKVNGVGLITGKPVQVEIQPASAGHGIVFYMEGTSPIPAVLDSVVHTDRGVTLANRDGKTLSIVEHFLCAASLLGLSDLKVSVYGAPELPILDGSAQAWQTALSNQLLHQGPTPSLPAASRSLPQALFYRHREDIALYAIPDTHFKITYSVDFNHPDLHMQWARWDSRVDSPALIATSCTFGYMDELPALQARGLALGASMENSLGLLEGGGYSRPLYHEGEPIYHKMLDLIGDLSLSGINPLTLQAHVFAINAGHSSHVPFARLLRKSLNVS